MWRLFHDGTEGTVQEEMNITAVNYLDFFRVNVGENNKKKKTEVYQMCNNGSNHFLRGNCLQSGCY